jgi:hypothetical protein
MDMEITTSTIGSNIRATGHDSLSDCDPAAIRELLRTQAWVYFTGFSPTVDEFREFTERFGNCATPRSIEYPPGGIALGFHAEDSYNPWRPDAVWFLCLGVGSDGGSPTGVVDGEALLRALDDDWKAFSLANDLRFTRSWPATSWQGMDVDTDGKQVLEFLSTIPELQYSIGEDDALITVFDTPIVVKTQDGRESFSNTMLHAITDQEYYGMTLTSGGPVPTELSDRITELALIHEIPIGWSDGDMVVIDNYRLMHRRAEYHGSGRELRVVHGEEFFGTPLPVAVTPAAMAMKQALQGEETLRQA